MKTIFKDIKNGNDNEIKPYAEIKIEPISDKDEVCLPKVMIKGTIKGISTDDGIYPNKISIYKKKKEPCYGDAKGCYSEYNSENESADGKFSIKTSLDEGKNTLYFATIGKNQYGKDTEILNNYESNYEKDGNFVLNYKPPTIAVSPSAAESDTGTNFEFWVDGRSDKQYISPSFEIRWDFGDGEGTYWKKTKSLPTKETPVMHQYSKAGEFTVTMQIRDEDNKDNDMKEVTTEPIIIKQKIVPKES